MSLRNKVFPSRLLHPLPRLRGEGGRVRGETLCAPVALPIMKGIPDLKNRLSLPLAAVLLVLMAAPPSFATVFAPTSDRQLVDRSEAVVVATVRDVVPRLRADGYVETEVHLIVEETLKGSATGTIELVELGGIVGTHVTFIADSATYTPGERVMAFLRQRKDGTWLTASMTLGKFDVRGALAVRQSMERGVEALDLHAFKTFVRDANALEAPARVKVTDERLKANNGNAKNYALTASGLPVRWPGCEVSCSVPFKRANQPTDPGGVIAAARGAWTNDPAAFINLTDGGVSTSGAPRDYHGDAGDENVIYFNYTGAFAGTGYNCDGALACTIGTGGFTHSFDGDTWVSIGDADIILSGSVTPGQLPAILTHELGHAIGIRHSDAGAPFSNTAIMTSSVPVAYGSTLQQWDKDAVDSLYGAGPVCNQPSITGTTGGGTVAAGQTTTLTVTATGTTPLNYQWYSGASGNTANPVGTNSNSYQTPPINAPSNFWVRVSNACGNADSSTITVTPAACQPVTINLQPQSQSISSGTSVVLQVGHGGTTPYTYQWFEGSAPDTTNAVPGANQRTFQTPNLTQQKSYWVQISNSCSTVNSATALITIIGQCNNPTITRQPLGLTLTGIDYLIGGGSNFTALNWYKGPVGNTGTPVAGMTPSNTRFVTQLYVDLLGRNADAGAGTIAAQLNANAITRVGAVGLITSSAEYRTLLVQGWYSKYLHRGASSAELSFWMPAFAVPLTDEQIESQLLGSAEYFALAGGTNSAWVTRIFNDLLGRAPSGAETSTYLGLLGGGSRTAVALSILNSTEARTRLVQGWLQRYLRRPPDAGAVTAFVGALGASTDETVQALILAADEYFNFGTIAIVGPGAGAAGSYWLQAVNTCGTANSNAAIVSAPDNCPLPSVTIQGGGTTINVGETPALTATALNPGPGIVTYQWYRGASGDTTNPIVGNTTAVLTNAPVNTVGTASFWVSVHNDCGTTNSSAVTVTVLCAAPKPQLSVQPTAPANTNYVVSWSVNTAVTSKFELQESTTATFTAPTTTTINSPATTATIPGKSVTTDTRFYYRVRSFATCGGEASAYSDVASVLVVAPPPAGTQPTSLNPTSIPCLNGNCTLHVPFFLKGFPPSGKTAGQANDGTYVITSDKPFVSVTPASGPLPPEGFTVNVNVDTTNMEAGSTEATLTLTKTQNASGKIGPTATSSGSVPISVNLVTPVTPKPKDGNPPVNTLLIPAVAHADGIGSHFQSDVRITNTSSIPITYQLTYTPSATDGTTAGKTSQLTIAGGDTKALNDVVEAWYGSGSAGEGGIGTLEIRPQTTSGKIGDVNISLATVASSRTYNVASTGTYGQFIPAMPLLSFLSKSDVSKLSLQQIAQNNAYRTNVGLVEGAGQAVDMALTLFDASGAQIAQRAYSLKPFEHQQQSLSALFPGTTLTDGRLQVQVLSDGGKVTAYASLLDNVTSDPLLVFPVDPSKVSNTRVVVPGIAELNNPGSNFHSDMRIFNGGTTDAQVTLTYTNADVPAQVVTVKAGEVKSFNDTLKTLWGLTGSGGAVIATTDTATPIVITARTFSRDANGGTYGQFIPGVTATDATGLNERALQVVQLEQSPAFRSNLGLVEVTGNPVVLDIAAFSPDSKVAAHVQKTLNGFEFSQLGSIFSQLGFPNTYNGRIAVSVIGGTGRVAAYGSVVDNRTLDPTYVPAQ